MLPERRTQLLEKWANVRRTAEELEHRLGGAEPAHGDFDYSEPMREAEIGAIAGLRRTARTLQAAADDRITALMQNGGKI